MCIELSIRTEDILVFPMKRMKYSSSLSLWVIDLA
jgi:hypothetical protein